MALISSDHFLSKRHGHPEIRTDHPEQHFHNDPSDVASDVPSHLLGGISRPFPQAIYHPTVLRYVIGGQGTNHVLQGFDVTRCDTVPVKSVAKESKSPVRTLLTWLTISMSPSAIEAFSPITMVLK